MVRKSKKISIVDVRKVMNEPQSNDLDREAIRRGCLDCKVDLEMMRQEIETITNVLAEMKVLKQ